MKEDDSISGLEEILGRRGTTRSGGEVVDEADRLVLERDGGAARSDQDDATLVGEVTFYECIGQSSVGVEGLRGRVPGEVVILSQLCSRLAANFRPWGSGRHIS